MNIRLKSAAIAVASALAVGAAGATGSTATESRTGGTGVLGSAPHSTTSTAVFAIDETEFMRLDTDRDGRLSHEETTGLTPLQHDWQSVDADRDGYLSRDELARYHANGGTKAADAARASGSSSHAATGLPASDPASKEPSRTLGMDNSAASSSAPSSSPSTTTGMDERTPGATAETEPGLMILVIDEPEFVRLDKDGDGQLSRDEVTAVGRMEQSWGAMDTNRDGLVSREELRTYQTSLGKGDGVQGGESRIPANRIDAPSGSAGDKAVADNTLTQPSGPSDDQSSRGSSVPDNTLTQPSGASATSSAKPSDTTPR